MPTKTEVLQEIDLSPVKSYTKELVKNLVSKVRQEREKPSKLKIGDVFVLQLSAKKRPVVVIAIKDTLVYGIPLTSTEDEMNLIPSKSRFFGNGWFSKSLVTVKHDIVMENFVGVYDNEKLLRKARRAIKDLIDTVL